MPAATIEAPRESFTLPEPKSYRQLVIDAATGDTPDVSELNDHLFSLGRTLADFRRDVQHVRERYEAAQDKERSDRLTTEARALHARKQALEPAREAAFAKAREIEAEAKRQADQLRAEALAEIRALDAEISDKSKEADALKASSTAVLAKGFPLIEPQLRILSERIEGQQNIIDGCTRIIAGESLHPVTNSPRRDEAYLRELARQNTPAASAAKTELAQIERAKRQQAEAMEELTRLRSEYNRVKDSALNWQTFNV